MEISKSDHSDHSQEEAWNMFAQYAENELAKAGSLADVRPSENDLGGFKLSHVSVSLCTSTFPQYINMITPIRHRHIDLRPNWRQGSTGLNSIVLFVGGAAVSCHSQ